MEQKKYLYHSYKHSLFPYQFIIMQFTKQDLNQTVWVHPDWQKENRNRWIVDATGKTLGRIGVEIAKKLQGKHKAHYADHRDTGDYVVVINAGKTVVTGNKLATKQYHRYSNYKGNLKSFTLKWMMEHKPLRVIELAIRGMLPKNKLRKPRMARLKLFAGTDHPYADKNLQPLDGATIQTPKKETKKTEEAKEEQTEE